MSAYDVPLKLLIQKIFLIFEGEHIMQMYFFASFCVAVRVTAAPAKHSKHE